MKASSPKSGRIVLSLDWDYATGDCMIDPACCGFCKEGKNRPQVRPEKPNVSSWDESRGTYTSRRDRLLTLTLVPGAPVYVAECHASIATLLRNHDWVIEYDAHCDGDPVWNGLNCGNWRTWVAQCHNGVYFVNSFEPECGDSGVKASPPPAHMAFICRSSPWTPREYDEGFWTFVRTLTQRAGVAPTFIGHRRKEFTREWQQRLEGRP